MAARPAAARPAVAASNGSTSAPAAQPPAPGGAGAVPPPAQEAKDIQDYWQRLKRGRPAPSYKDLEIGTIERRWPGALLLRYRPTARQIQIERKFASGGSGGLSAERGGMAISAMLVQWLTTLAREAARAVRPIERRETFEGARGTLAYRAVALPLIDESGQVERLLCVIEAV